MGRSLVVSVSLGALALGGCTALLGLEPPQLRDGGGGPDDGGRLDGVTDGAPDAVGSTVCPAGYTASPFGGIYRMGTMQKPWDLAAMDCLDDTIGGGTKHTHLIVLSSDAELNAATAFSLQADVWLGLTDRVTEGTYIWMTSDAPTYPPTTGPPWAQGQPANGVAADCVEMDQFAQLSEASCANTKRYICECDTFAADPTRY